MVTDSKAQEHGGAARRARQGVLTKLRNYFLAGVIVAAPVAITAFIVWQVVRFFDERVEQLLPSAYNPETYLPFSIPGLGLVIALGAITLIGMLTAGFVGRAVMTTGELVLNRMPVVRSLYSTLKQIFETVFSNSSGSFREVVLIEYPRRGIWAIAFLTGSAEGEVQERTETDLVNVFLPTTPNPTSGFLLFVPREDVIHLDMTIEEGIKMVISSGIVTPQRLPVRERAGQAASEPALGDVSN